MSVSALAVNGGKPVRTEPMPPRSLITDHEKRAAIAVFDEAIASGNAFGYGGRHEQQYEHDFVAFMGGGFADGVNSGTNAVFCALGGLQLDALSEVIVPPITDPGGVMPVLFVGCVPVFADAAPGSYNTGAEQIRARITERTRAIVVAHIAGEPVDMDPIIDVARERNLYVVEDCAQAHGAEYKDRKVGTIGHISAFSTMFGKHHCTGGQGGVVYSTDEQLHWQARRFADRGKPFNLPDETDNVVAGINCNLNELSAAIGTAQMRRLPEIIRKRRSIGEAVKDGLEGCPAVGVAPQLPDTNPVYWFLRFRIELEKLTVTKEAFCEALTAEGIDGVMPSYRHIHSEKPWFKHRAVFGKSGFPWGSSDYGGDRNPEYVLSNAVQASETHFNVWINENFGPREIDDMVNAITKVAEAYTK